MASQVFIDASAFYAVLDRDDSNHPRAGRIWTALLDGGADLVTTNYILVETSALVQHRLGLEAVRTLSQDMLPVAEIQWIGPEQHTSALLTLLTAVAGN